MGSVTLHPDAQQEFDETIAYYEAARKDLGREFRNEVMGFVERILKNPERYSVRQCDVRRANLDRFPYNVNYITDDGCIVIVAIAHNRRRPLYWLPRLDR